MIIPYKICLNKMAAPAGNNFYDFKRKSVGQTEKDKENLDGQLYQHQDVGTDI